MANKLKSDCFSIVNTNGEAVLFRTLDTSVNRLTLTISNKTGADLLLTGGEGSRSSFQFSLIELLTRDVMEHLTLTLPDHWGATFLATAEIPAWAIYPTEDQTLRPEESVAIVLTNISCPDTAPGNFYITYLNISGYDSPAFPYPKHLTVLNPPDPAKKTLPLDGAYTNVVHPINGQTGYEGTEEVLDDDKALPIFITYDPVALIENGFTYRLANTSKDPLVPVGPQPGSVGAALPPSVYISFLFGSEDYAVTTQQLADNNITIDVEASLPWKPVKHTGGTAYWQFLPESPQVMNGYDVVNFPIHKIVTALNVKPGTITIMYIQINDVPGYNDMSRTVLMHKEEAVAKMERLEPSKYFIYADEDITLSWASFLAKRVTIDYNLKDGGRESLDSEKGQIKLNAKGFWLPKRPTAEDTVITAIAYDNTGTSSIQKRVTVSYDWPKAEILMFHAGESLASLNELLDKGEAYVYVQWGVKYAREVVVRNTWGPSQTFSPKVTSANVPVNTTLHVWVDITLDVYSLNPKYTSPTSQTKRLNFWGGNASGEGEKTEE